MQRFSAPTAIAMAVGAEIEWGAYIKFSAPSLLHARGSEKSEISSRYHVMINAPSAQIRAQIYSESKSGAQCALKRRRKAKTLHRKPYLYVHTPNGNGMILDSILGRQLLSPTK